MPEKFVVPQFIDNEDKILGPITVRQFLICLGAAGIEFAWYTFLPVPYFILATIVTVGIAGTFGFLKVNGAPFHIFFINALQTLVRPKIRVWHKELNDNELRVLSAKPPDKQALAPMSTKARPESTRLRDLALTVNTGGVYNPDEDLER